VGIVSGGQWLAERLQADLGLPGAAGAMSSAMHRDDFAKRGLAASGQTTLPFDVDGADILLLDDVLLHRPHHARRAQRAVRLRPPGARAAGGAGRPRRAPVAGGGRVRRRAHGVAGHAVAGAGARARTAPSASVSRIEG
jgi:hypothetical protein